MAMLFDINRILDTTVYVSDNYGKNSTSLGNMKEKLACENVLKKFRENITKINMVDQIIRENNGIQLTPESNKKIKQILG